MKKAIVTGATGVIGTALISRLIQEQYSVLVVVRKESTRKHLIPKNSNVEILYAALYELKCIENIKNEVYDVFFHLAWDGTYGKDRNDMYLQNKNIEYALDAVAMAKRFGCHTFIGAGSQAEYGRVNERLTSKTPTFPECGYGYAKLCAGFMTRDYAHKLGMKHIWTRILSVYGINDGENTLVSLIIDKLKNDEIPKCTRGDQVWDYLNSQDAAIALKLIAEKGIDGKVYVLGSGEEKKLREYIYEIKDIINSNAYIDMGAIPYNDKQVMYLCADISELKQDCGFEPHVEFRDGIKNIISYR